jgi:hypothetical protein
VISSTFYETNVMRVTPGFLWEDLLFDRFGNMMCPVEANAIVI